MLVGGIFSRVRWLIFDKQVLNEIILQLQYKTMITTGKNPQKLREWVNPKQLHDGRMAVSLRGLVIWNEENAYGL